MNTGDLVTWQGSVGLVLGPCKKRWANPDDVWVLWTNKSKPSIVAGDFLELVNASR